jgi:ankyrin repeat protein
MQTALHVAADNGRADVVDHLVGVGANVEAKSNLGETPLHLAAENGSFEVVARLVEAGCAVDARSRSG